MTDPLRINAPYVAVNARHGAMLVNPNDRYVGHAVQRYGEYGEVEFKFLTQLLVRPGAIVEVGANIGTHTVPLARLGAQQRRPVIAFEPQPVIFQNLCANLALNGLMNVRAWPHACGAQNGTAFFLQPDYAASGNFGGIAMQADRGAGHLAVPVVRLDGFLGATPVGLMKIDVEGMERETLEGASDILRLSRPVLYVENDRPEKSAALIEWLWSQNYRLWWHVPPLFNPENFFGVTENIYSGLASCNMLCLPREHETPVAGLTEITDVSFHPQARS